MHIRKFSYFTLTVLLLSSCTLFKPGNQQQKPVQQGVEQRTESEGTDNTEIDEVTQTALEYEGQNPETYPINQLTYVDYTPTAIAEVDAAGRHAVLFFYASWCPTCQAVDKEIKENLRLVANNISIIKVDYDKETELKNKYNVTYQHTFVQVDQEGEMQKKWSGGNLESINSQVNL